MRYEQGVFLGSCLTCNIWKFLFSAEHDYPVWKLSIGDVDMPLYIWYLASIQKFSYQWNVNSRPDEVTFAPNCVTFLRYIRNWWKNIISSSKQSSSGSKNIHTTSLSDCIDIETVWTPIPELRHPKSIFECHFSLFFTERSHLDDI